MYKLIEKIEKVNNVEIIDNKLCYWKGNTLILNNKIIYEGNIFGWRNYNKVFVIAINSGENSVYINLNKNLFKEFSYISGVDFFINEEEIIYGKLNLETLKRYVTRINLITEEKKWTIEGGLGIGRILEGYLYSYCTNNRICKINLTHPEQPLWQFELSQLGTFYFAGDTSAYKVVQIIGIWNNLLLVQLRNARLIALDITTGKLKEDLEINKTNPSPVYYSEYTKMHLVKDKIIWLTNQSSIHIDLHTFTAKNVKEFYTAPREKQWIFKRNTYFEGKLYFTADYAWQYAAATYLGVMDAHTGEVFWSQQFKKTRGLPHHPIATKDKLYILTGNGELHIFEKEK